VSAPASPKPRWLRGGSFAVSGRPHPAIQPLAPAIEPRSRPSSRSRSATEPQQSH